MKTLKKQAYECGCKNISHAVSPREIFFAKRHLKYFKDLDDPQGISIAKQRLQKCPNLKAKEENKK